jgi:predicted glycoside hydrolase/deacetylase ChbG (UPF0249 family)
VKSRSGTAEDHSAAVDGQDRDGNAEFPPGAGVILVADDFGISDGVSRGIEELAAAGRLSATSAIVTLPTWPAAGGGHGSRLPHLRDRIAIGLHLNLTLGAPLGPMPRLAPDQHFPPHSNVLRRSLTGGLDTNELAAEIVRQLEAFERETGHPPDYLDGHQHVHALPVVRSALLQALQSYDPDRRMFVRDPADRTTAILKRRVSAAKALVISAVSAGFGAMIRKAGFATNMGFSGVSAFGEHTPYATELAAFFRASGPCHLVMCHPGYPDDALAALDPVVGRRRQELDAIMAAPGLDAAIWHVTRDPGTGRVRWPTYEARA